MSVLSFEYKGSEAARRGMQHGCSGDEVHIDDRGKGLLDKLDGAHALIEFGASGEAKRIVKVPHCEVYVVSNRAAPAPQKKSGHSGGGMKSITSFMSGAADVPTTQQTPPPRAARGGAFRAPSRGRV